MTKTTYVFRNGKLVVKEPVAVLSIQVLESAILESSLEAMRRYENAIFRAFLTPEIRPEPIQILYISPPSPGAEWFKALLFERNLPDAKWRNHIYGEFPSADEPADPRPPERGSEEPAPRPIPLKPWRWGDV